MGRVGVLDANAMHNPRPVSVSAVAVKVQFPRSRDAKCVFVSFLESEIALASLSRGESTELHMHTGLLPGAERSDIPRMGAAMGRTCIPIYSPG